MAESRDYILDQDGDLLIEDGDFVVGPSDQQHIEDILVSPQGDWRQHPLLGIGIFNYLKGANDNITRNAVKKRIRVHLAYDNYEVDTLDVSDLSNIDIDAKSKS